MAPAADAADALAGQLALAGGRYSWPAGGPGSREAGPDLERLADACGALLATSAAARGLFRDSPWDLDVSGGFASPLTAELISAADLIVGWGCSLNMWTMRHGTLIGPETTVVQVDDDRAAIGAHRPVQLGRARRRGRDGPRRAGRPRATAPAPGWGTAPMRSAERIEREVRWRTCRTPTRPGTAGSTRAR